MAVTTEPAWLNKSTGIAPRNGTTTHTIPFGYTPATGTLLVVFIYGAVTHTATGWTERLQPVSSGELSVFTKTSAGDTNIAVTHNGSDYPVAWVAYEFPTGATYTAGAGASPTADTFAALTGLPGTAQVVIAARGRATGATDASASSTWGAPWVEDADLTAPAAGTDGTYLTVAHQLNVTATSVTPAATTTYVGSFPADRQHVAIALDVPATGGTTATTTGTATAVASSASVTASTRTKTATGTARAATTNTATTTRATVGTATGKAAASSVSSQTVSHATTGTATARLVASSTTTTTRTTTGTAATKATGTGATATVRVQTATAPATGTATALSRTLRTVAGAGQARARMTATSRQTGAHRDTYLNVGALVGSTFTLSPVTAHTFAVSEPTGHPFTAAKE